MMTVVCRQQQLPQLGPQVGCTGEHHAALDELPTCKAAHAQRQQQPIATPARQPSIQRLYRHKLLFSTSPLSNTLAFLTCVAAWTAVSTRPRPLSPPPHSMCHISTPAQHTRVGCRPTFVLHMNSSDLPTPWEPMPESRKPWKGKWSGPRAGAELTCGGGRREPQVEQACQKG